MSNPVSDLVKIPDSEWPIRLGPAMQDLPDDRWRLFAFYRVEYGGSHGAGAKAARAAGFNCTTAESYAALAYRLNHDPRMVAAVTELVAAQTRALAPEALHVLKEIMGDVSHKDRLKAANTVLARTDPEIQKSEIKVEVIDPEAQAVALLKHLLSLYGDDMPGFGQVFSFAEDTYLHSMRPEDVPTHYLWLNGMDFSHFGLSTQAHPWAFVSCAIDPASGAVYVMHALRIKQQLAPVHVATLKQWGAWDAPCAWGADGNQRDSTGSTFAGVYKNLGVPMRMTHATLRDGSVSLESSLADMERLFAQGQLKVARWLTDLRQEIRDYAYDENNKVIPKDDDLVSALRYAVMDRRFAKLLNDARRASGSRRRGEPLIADGVDFDVFTGR